MISRHIVDLGDTVACPERHPAPTLVTEPRARLHLIAFARAGGACDRIALCGPTSVMALALLMEWRAVDLVVHKRESSTPSIAMSPDPQKRPGHKGGTTHPMSMRNRSEERVRRPTTSLGGASEHPSPFSCHQKSHAALLLPEGYVVRT